MQFEITGQVRERETGKPLPGLIIRVRDMDEEFEDGLGMAVTDGQGCFSLVYVEEKFRKVFAKQPTVYLAVYAPPFRHLVNTRQKARWGRPARANFAIVVSGKKVSSPAEGQENQVEGGVSLPAGRLRLDQVCGWHVPRLAEFGNGSVYGAPSILEQVQHVLIPAQATVSRLEIIPGPVQRKGRNVEPYPVQPPHITGPGDDVDDDERETAYSALQERMARFLEPDPRYYEGGPYPARLVELGYAEGWHGVQRIRVRVRPLQYDPAARQYLFYPHLRYIVHFEHQALPLLSDGTPPPAPRLLPTPVVRIMEDSGLHASTGAAGGWFANTGLIQTVIGAGGLTMVADTETVRYLIITDDYEWWETKETEVIEDELAETHPPDQHQGYCGPGSIVEQFKRLALWKTQRGLYSRVVTVSDIIANEGGKYGPTLLKRREVEARNLQEVIRNFIAWADTNWGVRYVLLGGDVNIIPMLKLIGYHPCQGQSMGWDCMRVGASDPPGENQVKFYSTADGQNGHCYTKIHYYGKTRLWWNGGLPLLTHRGRHIPYCDDPSSDIYPRWYFVSPDDFQVSPNSANFSGFQPYNQVHFDGASEHDYYVVVEIEAEHKQKINDDYYWVNSHKKIPTDFYYACAQSRDGIGDHERDFDENDNGFFGQFRWDPDVQDEVPVDGFCSDVDVYVGRAPVRTSDEARAFVDKVMSYELLEKVGTGPVMNTDYLKTVVHVADYSSRTSYKKCASSTLQTGTWVYDSGSHIAKIKKETDDPKVLDGVELKYRLILALGQLDQVVPRRPPGTGPCWQFMNSDFTATSTTETNYIRVYGVTLSDSDEFYWDPVGFGDAFHPFAEDLRQSMSEWFPSFTNVKRLYRDCFETPAAGEPALVPLTTDNMMAALDQGCHFVTVMAHGNESGFRGMKRDSFKSSRPGQVGTYIVVAQSCNTAYPISASGEDHSLGEQVVVLEGSGAVAYIGLSKTDTSKDKTKWVWDNIPTTRRLGRTAAACGFYDQGNVFYSKYNRMLYGDPEMPVWIKTPLTYDIIWPWGAHRGDEIVVTVRRIRRLPPRVGGSGQGGSVQTVKVPLQGHLVTFVAGWNPSGPDDDWQQGPELFKCKTTDGQGKARITIPTSLSASTIKITVCACRYFDVHDKYDYKPETHTLILQD